MEVKSMLTGLQNAQQGKSSEKTDGKPSAGAKPSEGGQSSAAKPSTETVDVRQSQAIHFSEGGAIESADQAKSLAQQIQGQFSSQAGLSMLTQANVSPQHMPAL